MFLNSKIKDVQNDDLEAVFDLFHQKGKVMFISFCYFYNSLTLDNP